MRSCSVVRPIILPSQGSDPGSNPGGSGYDQGKALLISSTIIVALTAQPFAKYFLIPWRKYWAQQDLTEKQAYRKV